ncbi:MULTISPECIES: hypothetical protein [unclassified Cyanobium]|uniref:hypothetical protein n=1 Tax=unclassified Cyanobium TaxID=2627006 RepID=UPI0020CDD1E1|nr:MULTISPECIES: hypothetical protein [unclassified Cyanobium]MCP9858556.1 helix-turn-helix domain-containing protein [Cyanobium sp. Cruz-8H5]MCP9865788.1 helix-turn-helix domain-containing protein [Cyanobium sp. Cruz-8D1]
MSPGAPIVLACGAGETNTAIADRMDLTGMTVGKRYRELGLEGLHDELRPGRPRIYGDDRVHRWLQTFSVQPRRQKHHRCAEA